MGDKVGGMGGLIGGERLLSWRRWVAKLVTICGSEIFLSDPVPRIHNAE
jgi:hypothetical protein